MAKTTAEKKLPTKAAASQLVAPQIVKGAIKGAAKEAAKAEVKTLEPKAKPAVTKESSKDSGFGVDQYVVYPAHGVGRITAIESQEVGGMKLEVFVIYFEKDRMTLRVPVNRAAKAGLRSLSNGNDITKAMQTLQGKAKTARGMWSRRAQEYEAKINSGNIVSIAEVVRDLHKNIDQPDRSYSERMIYESALNRLTYEVAAAESIDHGSATEKVIGVLKKAQAAAA